MTTVTAVLGGRTLRAWTAAFGILVAAYLVLGLFAYFERMPAPIGFLLRSAPLVAALVCSSLAPRYKLLSGILVAIPATFLEVALNLVVQLFGGTTDLPGWRGAIVASEMAMAFNLGFTTLGAVIGYYLSADRLHERL